MGGKKTRTVSLAPSPVPADDPMGGVTDERVAYLSRRLDRLNSPVDIKYLTYKRS